MKKERPWLRLYSELLNDPKVQNLPDSMFKAYINTLCIAGMAKPRGTIPPLEDYAFLLHVGKKQAEKIRNFLKISELLEENSDGFFIHNWDERQFESDNVTIRTQRHREKKKRSNGENGNVPETFQGTPPESEYRVQSTETEKEVPKVVSCQSAQPAKNTTDDVQDFFELTPGRMALAQAQGFMNASWVEEETTKFIKLNQGKRLRNPDTAWMNWLEAGRKNNIGAAKPFQGRTPEPCGYVHPGVSI